MVSPLKMPSISLPPDGQAENLRQRPGRRVGLQPLDRARRQREHAVRGLAAQHLLPGPGDDIELVPRQRHGERGRGGVADRQPGAVGGDPVAVRHAHARGGAVPGEHDVVRGIDRGEIGQPPVRRGEHARVGELQLLRRCRSPSPGRSSRRPAHRRRARPAATTAPSRRRRCRRPARCRAASRRACRACARRASITSASRALGSRGAMAAAEQRAVERVQRPAGTLGAGAGGEIGVGRTQVRPRRLIAIVALPFRREAPRWGGVARGRPIPGRPARKRDCRARRHKGGKAQWNRPTPPPAGRRRRSPHG